MILNCKKRARVAAIAAFSISEAILFSAVIFGGGGKWLEYSSVLLALVFSLIFINKSPSGIAIPLGLTFTALADICLVILSPMKMTLGVSLFLITQLSYAAFLYTEEKNERTRHYHIYTRVALALLFEGAMLIVLGRDADLLTAVTMLYFANLVANAILSYGIRPRIFNLGLILFILCDIFVGLSVLIDDYLPVRDGGLIDSIVNPDFNVVWLFYIPSQTLIALTVLFKRMNAERKAESESENNP